MANHRERPVSRDTALRISCRTNRSGCSGSDLCGATYRSANSGSGGSAHLGDQSPQVTALVTVRPWRLVQQDAGDGAEGDEGWLGDFAPE
jgi:hypothetical protein